MKMLKKFLIGMAAILPMTYFTAGYAFAADNSDYTIELNGAKLSAAASDELGMMNFPLRAVSEALGYTVEWNAKDHEVSLIKPDTKIYLDFDEYTITDGDHQYYMGGEMIDHSTVLVGKEFLNDCLGLKVEADDANKTVSLENITKNDISIKSVTETSTETAIDIALHYPQISGLADQTVQNSINVLLKQEADAAKKEGLDFFKENPWDGVGNRHQTYFDYRIKYNQNHLLSVVLLDYQYYGGAHGDTMEKAYTFNLNTGKAYSMKNLFKANTNFAALFNERVKSDIAKRELYALTPFESIADNQNYYLENDGVSVYFEPYEYFPHAAGIQVFTVDYAELNDLLNPELDLIALCPTKLDSSVKNILNTGETGTVTLKGNPTTGYSWHYTIDDDSIIKLDSESSVPDSGLMGAGSTFTWNFKALKPGETKITFHYYRPWESLPPQQTEEFTIKVQ